MFTCRICLLYFSSYTIKSYNNKTIEILTRDDLSLSDNQCHKTTCARFVTNDDKELGWIACVAQDSIVSNTLIN